MAKFNSILETIGNTPLVRIEKLAPEGVNLYAKLEYFNPMGSVKDRMALAMIEAAEQSGALQPGQTVIEATSGNTGIGLAMVCARKGYPLVVTMMESASVERRKLLRFLGARVVLTPASEKGTGMLRKAEELASTHGYFLTRQFDNEVNADIHSRTTAREILAEFRDEPLHYWVSGFGTGGTVKGVSRVLKAESPATRIMVAEPDNARLLGSQIRQARNDRGEVADSHPSFRPHLMQGWTPDFISPLIESALDEGWVDGTIAVDGNDALRYSRELATREGIFAGITAGATLAAGLEIARTAEKGTNIVCMVPDTGERYLSTPLFADIGEDMNEEELTLSRSTPTGQFGQPVTDDACPITYAEPADEAVRALVQHLLDSEPVVLFALEWCEFCWAAKKLFAALQIPFYSIELDSRTYQQDDLGGRIRKELRRLIGSPTIPQIFIGAEHIGGNMDLFDRYRDGSLREKLAGLGIQMRADNAIDPQALLPGWLQPRDSGSREPVCKLGGTQQ